MIYFTNIFESKVFSDDTGLFEGSGLCGTYRSIDGVCATCTNRCSEYLSFLGTSPHVKKILLTGWQFQDDCYAHCLFHLSLLPRVSYIR